ncbi:pectate lyase [Terrimonas rubra]|uniref:Pectate lyase n=1 Tax=Terrimonas rubra TaxID=1035890 RepID=A0ABW6A1G7_9BACT
MKNILIKTGAACLFTMMNMTGIAQQTVAFPGAEGFGKYTTGGRGGKVIKVTNLNDDGPGSLRAAITTKGPRIVVFDVSGTIELKSRLVIKNNDITIAGQTAPGDGICIRGYNTNIGADNVIIRYLRFRLGAENKQEDDALNGTNHKGIIIDHCSMTWSVDECASFYRNREFTLQWSLIAQSLNNSVHTKGNHGYGGIWGGEGASFHHNLIASNTSRNPRFSGSSTTVNPEGELVDFRNNVIFNWAGNSVYGGEKGRYNMVNNYYIPGPATVSKNVKARIVNPSAPYGQFFVAGNYMDGSAEVTADNWKGVHCEHPDSVKVNKAFEVVAISDQSAKEAYQQVLASAGASLRRDAVDNGIVNDVKRRRSTDGVKQNGIIDTPEQVGGWPVLTSLSAEKDTDGDGMPDAWEIKHGLNPDDAGDAVKYTLQKAYTNIEVYINSIVK